jgi:hypothetical protein
MDPGAQFLFLRNPAKQSIELKPLLPIKGRANGVVVFPGDAPNLSVAIRPAAVKCSAYVLRSSLSGGRSMSPFS